MTPLRRYALTTLLVLATAGLSSSPALAQDGGGVNFGFGTSSTTTWLGATASTVGVVFIIIWLVSPDDGEAAMQEYLQQNGAAVAQDVAMGGGASLDEISVYFGVHTEHRARFAQVLRAENTDLQALLAGEDVTREQARAFIAIVSEVMLADDVLSQDVNHWKAQVAAR